MIQKFRYILKKKGKKDVCPSCEKRKFVRYVDEETGQLLPEIYGRCDREMKCGYFRDPYTDGYAKAIRDGEKELKIFHAPLRKRKKKREDVPLPEMVLKATQKDYEKNGFLNNLLENVDYPFPSDRVKDVTDLYRLGTIGKGYMQSACTFPFIDINENIRAIQAKTFDSQNHTKKTSFVHSIIKGHYIRIDKKLPIWLEEYEKNDLKVSCLFGEHLLKKYPGKPIALVEAPKTAIYGTLYFGHPNEGKLLWLAVFNLSSLNKDKCRHLNDRDVFLFPDLSEDGKAYELWRKKAKEIERQIPGACFYTSDLLEQIAPKEDRKKGADIADYLIKMDWRNFK